MHSRPVVCRPFSIIAFILHFASTSEDQQPTFSSLICFGSTGPDENVEDEDTIAHPGCVDWARQRMWPGFRKQRDLATDVGLRRGSYVCGAERHHCHHFNGFQLDCALPYIASGDLDASAVTQGATQQSTVVLNSSTNSTENTTQVQAVTTSSASSTKKQRQHERAAANARVVRALKESANWREVAAHNDVPYSTARRAALNADGEPTTHGGVRGVRVKMTMKVMGKLEQYLDEDCRHTCEQILKKLRIEKVTMNKAENKNKRKEFVNKLEKHASRGDMIVFHDETNFNMYLSRNEGYSRVGERATVALTPLQGSNLHVLGGVSSGTGTMLMRTHAGSVKKQENARFVADLFTAALGTEEYCELAPTSKIVI
ncbi:hypothetical protein PC123_g14857 [Phytophthora cactorum]|nr:hypothetical protein PC123_g14857 [Phytophthora cactorum]